MYTISKQFTFSASHQLEGLPPEHQCARLHGHNYIIEAVLQSDSLNEVGFVEDYGQLADIKEWIDTALDHRHLNDVFDRNTTAENIAYILYRKFIHRHPLLVAIRVSETAKTWAEYRPSANNQTEGERIVQELQKYVLKHGEPRRWA